MSGRHIPAWLLGLLNGWLIGEIALLWPKLPPSLATHFGFAGEPNGWSTSTQFLTMTAVLLALFWGLFALSSWLECIPDRFLNLPNKAYWLDASRRALSLAAIKEWLRWYLVVTLAALVAVLSAVLTANLLTPPHLSTSPILVFAAFLLPQLVMIVWLFWRFRLPRA